MAAIANDSAGAGVCQEAMDAINAGQILLVDVGFDGTGEPFGKKKDEVAGHTREEANTLAATLDSYNNGTLCATP